MTKSPKKKEEDKTPEQIEPKSARRGRGAISKLWSTWPIHVKIAVRLSQKNVAWKDISPLATAYQSCPRQQLHA